MGVSLGVSAVLESEGVVGVEKGFKSSMSFRLVNCERCSIIVCEI